MEVAKIREKTSHGCLTFLFISLAAFVPNRTANEGRLRLVSFDRSAVEKNGENWILEDYGNRCKGR